MLDKSVAACIACSHKLYKVGFSRSSGWTSVMLGKSVWKLFNTICMGGKLVEVVISHVPPDIS